MIPIILSGGSGSRLWPVSRESYPKQFCDFFDQSFLQSALRRLKSCGEPVVVTLTSMSDLTRRVLRLEGLDASRVLLEPVGKNTAPAVALACRWLQIKGMENEIAGVFPADHLVLDVETFQQALQLATEVAKKGHVVTLGIRPHSPATGYGYIEIDQSLSSTLPLQAHRVLGFKEKPHEFLAREYVQSGRHYWNAGMFVFRASVMIENLQRYQPELWRQISEVEEDFSNLHYKYSMVESISLDYALMEKLTDQMCIPCDVGWSDIGSWDELARVSEEIPGFRLNSQTSVFTHNAHNNAIFSTASKVVGLIGVDDLILVETPDATLIVRKGQSQDVKSVLGQIKEAGLPAATHHLAERRPWGDFEILADRPETKVKMVQVDSGERLSYQSHERRVEHWVIVSGQGKVTLDGAEQLVKHGDYVRVSPGVKHRIENCGTEPLVFVETQLGEYFGEDDIVRYEDDYNRLHGPYKA